MAADGPRETPNPAPASFGFAFGLGLLVASIIIAPLIGLFALLFVVLGIVVLGASLADILDHLRRPSRE